MAVLWRPLSLPKAAPAWPTTQQPQVPPYYPLWSIDPPDCLVCCPCTIAPAADAQPSPQDIARQKALEIAARLASKTCVLRHSMLTSVYVFSPCACCGAASVLGKHGRDDFAGGNRKRKKVYVPKDQPDVNFLGTQTLPPPHALASYNNNGTPWSFRDSQKRGSPLSNVLCCCCCCVLFLCAAALGRLVDWPTGGHTEENGV